ncbi:LytTR family DNA-binding domain-containing protein [Pseudoalteromonas sp. SSDWG2]|uniref:LytTR family DNA-binding domain-containing protein n=1 Tax=Pseudoalteromonas sp. SSDWG2 TaxID=3139391 RepID=UPI003BA91D86
MKFIENTRHYFYLAAAMGLLVLFVMVFIQPFDTNHQFELPMVLKLSGYGVMTFLALLANYFFEKRWFINAGKRWSYVNEAWAMLSLLLWIAVFTNVYHAAMFSDGDKTLSQFIAFTFVFVIPFVFVVFPLVILLRQQFGVDANRPTQSIEHAAANPICVTGANTDEHFSFLSSHFRFAAAQQNYVVIHINNDDQLGQEAMIRSTLTEVQNQIPDALRVHRSYIVNPASIKDVLGSKRKANLILHDVEQPIPVSSTYYDAVKSALQIHP